MPCLVLLGMVLYGAALRCTVLQTLWKLPTYNSAEVADGVNAIGAVTKLIPRTYKAPNIPSL